MTLCSDCVENHVERLGKGGVLWLLKQITAGTLDLTPWPKRCAWRARPGHRQDGPTPLDELPDTARG